MLPSPTTAPTPWRVNIEHEHRQGGGRSTLLAPSPGTDLETLNRGNRVLASSLLQFHRALVRDRKGGDS